MLAMTADHVAWAFVATDSVLGECLHFIGRLVAPLMAYFLVVGHHHTKDVRAYALRLGVFAIISQPFYVAYQLAINDTSDIGRHLWHGNVLFGLMLALGALWVRHLTLMGFYKIIAIIIIYVCAGMADYGRALVLWVLLFDGFYDKNFDKKDCGDKAGLVVAYVLTLPVMYVAIYGFRQTVGLGFMHFGMVLTAFCVLMYNGKKGRTWGGRYLLYVFYPVHLGILAWVRWLS